MPIFLGYIIEKMEYPVGRWQKCNFANVSVTGYCAENLIADAQYQFRVFAKNAAGSISIPSMTVDPITVKNDYTVPKIEMDARFSEEVSIRAGQTLKLEANVRGKPTPTITWLNRKGGIVEDGNISIKSAHEYSSIEISAVERFHTGAYTIMAKNLAGSKYVISNQ